MSMLTPIAQSIGTDPSDPLGQISCDRRSPGTQTRDEMLSSCEGGANASPVANTPLNNPTATTEIASPREVSSNLGERRRCWPLRRVGTMANYSDRFQLPSSENHPYTRIALRRPPRRYCYWGQKSSTQAARKGVGSSLRTSSKYSSLQHSHSWSRSLRSTTTIRSLLLNSRLPSA